MKPRPAWQPSATGRRALAAALAALAIAAMTVTGCGAKDDGGVITPPKTTTTIPSGRS